MLRLVAVLDPAAIDLSANRLAGTETESCSKSSSGDLVLSTCQQTCCGSAKRTEGLGDVLTTLPTDTRSVRDVSRSRAPETRQDALELRTHDCFAKLLLCHLPLEVPVRAIPLSGLLLLRLWDMTKLHRELDLIDFLGKKRA